MTDWRADLLDRVSRLVEHYFRDQVFRPPESIGWYRERLVANLQAVVRDAIDKGAAPAVIDVHVRQEFGRLGGEPVLGPVLFQGGVIFLRGYGCARCGNAFWVEDDRARRLKPGSIAPCPHCHQASVVPEASDASG